MDMLKDMRGRSDVPVLVLSARKRGLRQVRALQLGADDYMTSRFGRRSSSSGCARGCGGRPSSAATWVEVGALRIEPRAPGVQVKGERVELTRVNSVSLRAGRRPGEAMTRRWLAERALDPERGGHERTLDVHVSRLRKKLVRRVRGDRLGHRLPARSMTLRLRLTLAALAVTLPMGLLLLWYDTAKATRCG